MWALYRRVQWKCLTSLQPGLSTLLLWPRSQGDVAFCRPCQAATSYQTYHLWPAALKHFCAGSALCSLLSLRLLQYEIKRMRLWLQRGIKPGLANVESIQGRYCLFGFSLCHPHLCLPGWHCPSCLHRVRVNTAVHPLLIRGSQRDTIRQRSVMPHQAWRESRRWS